MKEKTEREYWEMEREQKGEKINDRKICRN